jgi:hypothetical protein
MDWLNGGCNHRLRSCMRSAMLMHAIIASRINHALIRLLQLPNGEALFTRKWVCRRQNSLVGVEKCMIALLLYLSVLNTSYCFARDFVYYMWDYIFKIICIWAYLISSRVTNPVWWFFKYSRQCIIFCINQTHCAYHFMNFCDSIYYARLCSQVPMVLFAYIPSPIWLSLRLCVEGVFVSLQVTF